jgi:gephyrin
MSSLRPAVLVISDTASQDPQTDKAGPALTEAFSQRSSTWAAPIVRIVPDDPEQIQSTIKEWADNGSDFYNLIVTSGGTGFAVRDVTPEVRGFESILFLLFHCQLLVYINSVSLFDRQSRH